MLYCESCGRPIQDDSRFCPECGATVEGDKSAPVTEEALFASAGQMETADDALPEGIDRGIDGVLRWSYELNLWKNPTALISLFKIFGGIVAGISVFMFFITLSDGFQEALWLMGNFFLFGTLGAFALVLLGFVLYSLIQGGKYYVIFEMDEKGVNHIQLDKQFKKAQVLAVLAAYVGAATGRPSMVGGGILAGSRQSLYTSFNKVRRVKGKPERDVIYVNEKLNHNQIYVTREQYGFVLDFIRRHCRDGIDFSG